MILGVDVYSGYGSIAWAEVARAGVRFAFVKCSEGNEGFDPAFAANVAGCRANGIIVGGYHFAFPLERDVPNRDYHPGRTPEEQVEIAWRGCGGLGSRTGELPHVVDAEWPAPQDWAKWGCTPAQISAWMRRYCELATERWGRRPLIYTYPHWWSELDAKADVAWAAEYGLWLANYVHPGPGLPPANVRTLTPATWRDWTILQFSADGSPERVPGIPVSAVCRDCIRDEATLRRLAWLEGEPTRPELVDAGPSSEVPTPRIVDFPIPRPRVPLGRPALDGELDGDGDDE